MVFHWSLSDNKSPQVSRTLLSILADLNNAVVWIVSACLVISKSSSLYTNPSVSVPRAPVTIDIIVTFKFRSFFFQFHSHVKLLIPLFALFQFYPWIRWDSKVHNFLFFLYFFFFFFFFLIIISSGRLAEIRWSVCISKSQRSLCESFSWTDSGLYKYHLFVWPNFSFLHNSPWITFPTQSYLVLYSFCANLLYSLNLWSIVSSLSQHNLHLLFCCVLSILALIWLVFMTLFWAAIRRDSVSFLRFPFISHVQSRYYVHFRTNALGKGMNPLILSAMG